MKCFKMYANLCKSLCTLMQKQIPPSEGQFLMFRNFHNTFSEAKQFWYIFLSLFQLSFQINLLIWKITIEWGVLWKASAVSLKGSYIQTLFEMINSFYTLQDFFCKSMIISFFYYQSLRTQCGDNQIIETESRNKGGR